MSSPSYFSLLRALIATKSRRCSLQIREAAKNQKQIPSTWMNLFSRRFAHDPIFAYELAKYYRGLNYYIDAVECLTPFLNHPRAANKSMREFVLNAKRLFRNKSKDSYAAELAPVLEPAAKAFFQVNDLGKDSSLFLEVPELARFLPPDQRSNLARGFLDELAERGRIELQEIEAAAMLWRVIILRLVKLDPADAEQWIHEGPLLQYFKEFFETTQSSLDEQSTERLLELLFRSWVDVIQKLWIEPLHGEAYRFRRLDKDHLARFCLQLETNRSALRAVTHEVRSSLPLFRPTGTQARRPAVLRRVLILYPKDTASHFLPGVIDCFESFGTEVRTFCLDLIGENFEQPGFFSFFPHYKMGSDSNFSTLEELFDWSDLVMAEWCDASAIFASNYPLRKPLIVRLHAYEAAVPFSLQSVNWSRVDGIVFVAEHIRKLTHQVGIGSGLETLPSIVIPNLSDLSEFAQDKSNDAKFSLGLLQYHPRLKDPLYALKILAELRKHDERFILRLAGPEPVFSSTVSKDERAYWDEFNRSLAPLRDQGAVVIDGFQTDVAAWLGNIGWILSTSLEEGTHESIREGIASGAIPVVRDWPRYKHLNAAETQYRNALIHSSPAEAAEKILASIEDPRRVSSNDTGSSSRDHREQLISFVNEILNQSASQA